jgi:hypothetical protein
MTILGLYPITESDNVRTDSLLQAVNLTATKPLDDQHPDVPYLWALRGAERQ